MPIINQDSQAFEPYARLMNIIGDQLITNKKVAVIEIIKNSYDADAENVQIRFFNIENYDKTYLTEKERPYIEIEDDGEGMTLDIIKNVWLRPATPSKLDKKRKKQNYLLKPLEMMKFILIWILQNLILKRQTFLINHQPNISY